MRRIDEAIDGQLRKMKLDLKVAKSPLEPLSKKTRVRGRKPHDPQFDVRTALYTLVGIDSTAIEGIDEIHALTLISELGTDFTKWPTVKHFASWAHICIDSVRGWHLLWRCSSSKTRRAARRKRAVEPSAATTACLRNAARRARVCA